MLKDSDSIQAALNIIEERDKQLTLMKRHTAQKISRIAARDRQFIFEKLRKKVKEAAEAVSEAPLSGEIGRDMSDVASVRREAEALFGKINSDTEEAAQAQAPKSNQLNFLIGVSLNTTASSREEKPAQVIEVRD